MQGFNLIIVLIIIPFVINLFLIALAVTDLMQREKVKYLSKTGWIVIIALLPFSSLIYLAVGRSEKGALQEKSGR